MPCFQCGRRQTDPGKGPSDWKRGVVASEQVLICPSCQAAHDWQAFLDRCSSCNSVLLFRQLGETKCKSCGRVGDAIASAGEQMSSVDSSLSDQVAEALARRFSR